MQLPLTDPDTLFEELLPDLPPETMQMAREFKAFVRAKKVKTPAQLLRVVFLYCGSDKTLVRWQASVRPCMRLLRTKRWRSACVPAVRGCKRCSGGCSPSPRSIPYPKGCALWLSTLAVFKPQGPRALIIASILRWTSCPCSFSRCWSAMSIRVKHSNISPWLQGMWSWQTEAMPSARACVWRLSRGPRSSYGSIPSVWS